jgi:transposase
VHKELHKPRNKGVTLQLLWEEYRAEHPEGYGYTQFCEYYKRFRSQLEPAIRQEYKAGEKMFVDWAGPTIPVLDRERNRVWEANLFVAALGASNYTYAEAFADRKFLNWAEAHIHAWEFFEGVAAVTTPDNEKTAVSQVCRYEPEPNASYHELLEYYGTALIPARSGKATDKAKVEAAVLNTERRILAVLRNQTFFSLGELNRAIRTELRKLNERPFKKLVGCRAEFFAELDKPALLALPAKRYEIGTWQRGKANIDYHVQVDSHNYSVPHRLVTQPVEVRLSARTVEIYHRGKRVALHPRSHLRGKFTTDPAHRPKSHAEHLDWSPGRLIRWAATDVGEHCGKAVATILDRFPHPEQGYRSCLGIKRLSKRYGIERVEAACRRAVALDVCSYRSIKSMLQTGMDSQPVEDTTEGVRPSAHRNIRGRQYYVAAKTDNAGKQPQKGG